MEGVNAHSAILTVFKNNVSIQICLNKTTKRDSQQNRYNIEQNKHYIYGFVLDNSVDELASYVLEAYKQYYGRVYNERTEKGIILEIYLHLYMYYFDIDKADNYKHSKEIDIDNNGNGLTFEKRSVKLLANRIISMCKNSILKNKSSFWISTVLKKYI